MNKNKESQEFYEILDNASRHLSKAAEISKFSATEAKIRRLNKIILNML